jgi:hypothetical protein
MLRDGRGEAIVRYGSLEAQDAVGNGVPVRMSTEAGALVIVVEDDGAVWPITVQALASSPIWNVSITQAGGSFGTSVSTAADVDGNGYSDVIVGAPLYDAGNPDEGAVFVFLASAGGVSTSPAWNAQAEQTGANMGTSVAAGDFNGDGYGDVLVGAPAYDLFATDLGGAFIWLGSAGGLGPMGTPLNADWLNYGNNAFDNFGASVARAGDVNHDGYDDVIVGIPGGDDGNTFDDGLVLVFHGGPSGPGGASWIRYYTSDFGGANFGNAVAGVGDVNGDGVRRRPHRRVPRPRQRDASRIDSPSLRLGDRTREPGLVVLRCRRVATRCVRRGARRYQRRRDMRTSARARRRTIPRPSAPTMGGCSSFSAGPRFRM